jgi:hypothetical protein
MRSFLRIYGCTFKSGEFASKDIRVLSWIVWLIYMSFRYVVIIFYLHFSCYLVLAG